MRVLGIETSCDETAVALYDSDLGLLADVMYSQISTHEVFGGVVPELASRDHIKYIIGLVKKVLKEAKLNKKDIDIVAYTAGPGLMGALLTGASFAKSFAYAENIPAIAVHHLEAHLLAAQMENQEIQFPFLGLIISGGHTMLIEAISLGKYRVLGETLDDAVGEAFDKTAKLMGISYPGGAKLANLADRAKPNMPVCVFPRPMTEKPGLDFSFSGLKTHALMEWTRSKQDELAQICIAKAFQEAVVDTLLIKCKRALNQCQQYKSLVVAGGVSANRAIREAITELMTKHGGKAYFPSIKYCTDNGAMVAYVGCLYALNGKKDTGLDIKVQSTWPFEMHLG